jgi:hypothetical protein
MSSPHKEWTVLPHGPLEEIDDGILTVTGEIGMPLAKLERRMTVVRLNGRRLVIYSAIALDPAGMARLESFGQPAFLIVPSDLHRLDARIYKDRYPAMKVVAPQGARKKVEEVVPVDTGRSGLCRRDREVRDGAGRRGARRRRLSCTARVGPRSC